MPMPKIFVQCRELGGLRLFNMAHDTGIQRVGTVIVMAIHRESRMVCPFAVLGTQEL